MAVLVHVYDLKSSRVGEYRLDDELIVGRDEACDIILSSPYISPKHAELRIVDKEVFVHAIGFNGVFVNDTDVPSGSNRLVQSGDVTSVPGYVLHLTGLEDSEQHSAFELEQQFSTLKAEIHSELLANAGLRDIVFRHRGREGSTNTAR